MCSVRAKLKERMANFCSGFSFPENQSGRRGHYEQSGPGRCEGANSKWGASSIGPPKPNTQWNSRQTSMSDSRGVQGEEGQTRIAIRDITPHQANTVMVGIVVSKQKVHSFPDKKNPGCERSKFTFTLRDSPSDYINATCWGTEEHVRELQSSFKICDVVEVQNGQISSKRGGEDDKWSPWTPSQYQINISETYSSLSLYSGWDYTEFTALAHVPLRPPNDYSTLSDIISSGQTIDGAHLNILAIVKQCCSVKTMTSKTGKALKKCDIYLMDEGCPHFLLVMWDDELIELAQTWTPRDNILFAVDVKVTYDTYRNSMIATCDQKTIITTNPDCQEAHHLYQFAQTVDLSTFQDPGLDSSSHHQSGLGALNDSQDDIETITQVYTVEELKNEQAAKFGAGQNSFTGIMFAYLTSFDIDQDINRVVCYRCSKCKYRVDKSSSQCSNKSCSNMFAVSGGGSDRHVFNTELQFNMLVSLSDCTGTIESVVVTGDAASNLLMCSPPEFLCKSESGRTELKSGLILEKFKVYFKCISSLSRDQKKVSIRVLSMLLADPKDVTMNISR